MNVSDIVRMANQITDFFAVYPKAGGARRHREAHPCNVGAAPAQYAEGAPRHRRGRIESPLHRGDDRIFQRPEQPERPTC